MMIGLIRGSARFVLKPLCGEFWLIPYSGQSVVQSTLKPVQTSSILSPYASHFEPLCGHSVERLIPCSGQFADQSMVK